MALYRILWEDPENHERHTLGTESFSVYLPKDVITQALMDHFWDARLDSADCIPIIIKEQ